MPEKSNPFKDLTSKTTDSYGINAEDFWEGTKDYDVSQNYQAFLSALPSRSPLSLLDFGCGPGRDLLYFSKLGHRAVGLEGSQEFCRMARRNSNCEVLQQDFIELNLPENTFDGIFANASLFHVPRPEFPRILAELKQTLKPQGILFSSNPRGDGEHFDGERYANFMEFPEYSLILENAGFEVLTHYYRPTGLPLAQQPWLAVVSRRRD